MIRLLLGAVALSLSRGGVTAAPAAPTWIALSNDALQVLQRMSPQVQVPATTGVSVTVPEAARSSRQSAPADGGLQRLRLRLF